MSSKNISLTEGNIKVGILRFAFPMFLGQLFQQLYNVVDAIVVGNYVGQNALAAVTSTGSLIFLIVGFFGGVFSGVTVIISRYFGANDNKNVKKAVGTAVSFGLISGVILTIVGTLSTPIILRLMGTPDNVFQDASTYIRTYFLGVIFVIMYNTGCGIFNAIGDSKHPLYYLIVSAVVNVILDIIFVKFFNMGVAGAKFGVLFSCISAEVIGITIMLLCPYLIRIFGDSQDVIAVGVQRAQLNSLFFFLLAFSHFISGVLRGAGKSKVPMFTMLICWCLIRVSYIKIATALVHDISLVFLAYPLTWGLSSVVFLIYYKKSNWLKSYEAQTLIEKAAV